MKSLLILTALLLTGFFSQAQNLSASSDEKPIMLGVSTLGNEDKVVSFYEQIEQQTGELKEARKTYVEALANAETEEEKEMNEAILSSIDQMIRTNHRIMEGSITIQSID
ncbi:MAG: hypothetical protein R3D00_13345 [Bacteroidia bacterium]